MISDAAVVLRSGTVVMALALALGASACGDSDSSGNGADAADTATSGGQGSPPDGSDERAVRAAFEEFKDAYFNGDTRAGCDVMTEVAQKQFATLGSDGIDTCEERLEQIVKLNRTGKPGDPKPSVTSVQVNGDTAVLVTTAPDTGRRSKANFIKEDGEWKMNSAFGE